MRFALIISTLLHASILLVAAYGLPRMAERFEIKEEPLIVDLVTIGDETTPQPAELLPPPDAEEPPPPKVAMAPPPAPPKLEVAPPPPAEPQTAEAPPPPPPPMPKVEKRPPPAPAPKLAMAPPPSRQKLSPPPPAPPPAPKPVAATPPAPLPKVPKPPKKVIAKLTKAPRPKAKPKPPKKDFKSTLDRIAALLDKSEKVPSPPSERAEKTSRTPPRSRTTARVAASATEARELTIREMDALRLTIRKQIEVCWSVPGGARDAGNLIVRVHFFLNPDGSLVRPPEVVDRARMFAAGGDFYRTAAESARRAVLHCSPLANLPIEKYEYWREVTLTFNPKDMLR